MELNDEIESVSSHIEATYSITRDEYLESMRLYISQFKWIRLFFFFILGGFFGSRIYLAGLNMHTIITVVITIIVFVLIFKISTHFQRKRVEEKCLVSRKLVFTQSGLETQTANGHSFLKYSAFEKYQSNSNMGLLYISKRMFYILPFRVFNQEELEVLLREKNLIKK